MSDALVRRLAALASCIDENGFSPEQVARALLAGRERFAVLWMSSTRSGVEVWDQIEAAMLAALEE
jgi:hypothetical protein